MKIKKYKTSRWCFAAVIFAMSTLNAFAAPAASGADTFKAKCAMCHGPNAGGSTPMGQRMKIRDLRTADVQKQTEAELTAIISNGKAPMPGYAKSLSGGDIQLLVAYLRSIAAKS